MAINRYTKPVQAQYIPMDMNTYTKLGEAGIAANQKPWNIISAIQARREKQYGEAVGMQSQIEEGIGGIKGINPHDQQIVNSRKEHYYKLLNDAIKKTGGNPAAMLPALTSINRSFRLDAVSGPLSEVNQRYSVGMEDLKQAKKDVSSGKLSPEGYRLQSQLLGTGVIVPRTGDIDSSAKKMLTGDFKNSRFRSDAEAYNNFQQNMINKYRDIYYRLSDRGKADMLNQLHSAFNQYYRNENSDANKRSIPVTQVPIGESGNKNVNFINLTSDNFNKKGDIVKPKMGVLESIKYSYAAKAGAADQYYGEKIQDAKDKMDKYSKALNLPSDLPAKEKTSIINNSVGKYVGKANTPFKMPTNSNAQDFSLTDKNGDFIDLTGSTIEVRTGNGGWKKVDGDSNQAVRKLFSKKGDDKAHSVASHQSTKGGLVISGSDVAPGSIVYNITDEEGNEKHIRVTSNDPYVQSLMGPSWSISKAIESGDINKILPVRGIAKVATMDENGKINPPVQFDHFKVVGRPEYDKDGKISNIRFVTIPYKDGEPVKSYDAKKKAMGTAITSPELLFNNAYKKIVEYRTKKK